MVVNTAANIHKNVICANCFIKKDGKYLVLRRSVQKKYAPGVVHPVGGKVNANENALAAAIREVKEETGVDVHNIRLRAVLLELEPHIGEPYNWLIFHFMADYLSGEVKDTEEGDLIWLTTEEFKKEKLFPSVKPIVNYMFDRKNGPVFATFAYDDRKQIIIKSSINACQAEHSD